MKKTLWARWFAAILFVGGFEACSPKDINVGSWLVIPLPQEITEVKDAAPFVINSSTVICYPEGNEKLKKTAHLKSSWLYAANYFFTFTQIVSPCDRNRTGEIFSSSCKVVRIFVCRALIV